MNEFAYWQHATRPRLRHRHHEHHFAAAQTRLGEGAMDLLFNATLVKPFTGDTYYVLEAFEVIE